MDRIESYPLIKRYQKGNFYRLRQALIDQQREICVGKKELTVIDEGYWRIFLACHTPFGRECKDCLVWDANKMKELELQKSLTTNKV